MFDIAFYIIQTLGISVMGLSIYKIISIQIDIIGFQKVCTSIHKYAIICFI